MQVFRRHVALFVVLACILARGIASAQTFTGVGAAPASAEVLAPLGDVVSYAVSGTFVGTVVVEQSQGGGSAAWVTRVTLSAPGTGTFIAETVPPDGSGTPARYRFRCSAYTSGTIVAALSSAAAPTGSGTPGGADTQVQFNDAGTFGGDPKFTYTTFGESGGRASVLIQNTEPSAINNGSIDLDPGSSFFRIAGQDNNIDGITVDSFIALVDQTNKSLTSLEVRGIGSVAAGKVLDYTHGIDIDSVGSSSGTITQNIGLYIASQANAAFGSSYALYYDAPSSKTFSIDANGDVIANGTTTSTFVSQGSGVAVANVGANSCGTTTATIAGNDNAGTITVGATSGSQCRVTFVNTAATRRECTVTDETTTIATRAAYVDASNTDFLGGFGAGDLVSYVCFAR